VRPFQGALRGLQQLPHPGSPQARLFYDPVGRRNIKYKSKI